MSNHFAHGYALLIGVGRTAESRYSLPVTVKDVQALKTVLTDPNLCAYLDDSEHIRLLQNEQTTRSAILEEQAASFGIRMPVDLQIELEEKRRQVTELESRHQRTGLD